MPLDQEYDGQALSAISVIRKAIMRYTFNHTTEPLETIAGYLNGWRVSLDDSIASERSMDSADDSVDYGTGYGIDESVLAGQNVFNMIESLESYQDRIRICLCYYYLNPLTDVVKAGDIELKQYISELLKSLPLYECKQFLEQISLRELCLLSSVLESYHRTIPLDNQIINIIQYIIAVCKNVSDHEEIRSITQIIASIQQNIIRSSLATLEQPKFYSIYTDSLWIKFIRNNLETAKKLSQDLSAPLGASSPRHMPTSLNLIEQGRNLLILDFINGNLGREDFYTAASSWIQELSSKIDWHDMPSSYNTIKTILALLKAENQGYTLYRLYTEHNKREDLNKILLKLDDFTLQNAITQFDITRPQANHAKLLLNLLSKQQKLLPSFQHQLEKQRREEQFIQEQLKQEQFRQTMRRRRLDMASFDALSTHDGDEDESRAKMETERDSTPAAPATTTDAPATAGVIEASTSATAGAIDASTSATADAEIISSSYDDKPDYPGGGGEAISNTSSFQENKPQEIMLLLLPKKSDLLENDPRYKEEYKRLQEMKKLMANGPEDDLTINNELNEILAKFGPELYVGGNNYTIGSILIDHDPIGEINFIGLSSNALISA